MTLDSRKDAPKIFLLEAGKYLFFLIYIAMLAGLVFWSWQLRQEKISFSEQSFREKAVTHVLPLFDNEPLVESFLIADRTVYTAKRFWAFPPVWTLPGVTLFRQTVGFALESESEHNGRQIRIYAGLNPEGVLTGVWAEQRSPGFSSSWKKIGLPDFEGVNLENWQKKAMQKEWAAMPKDVLTEIYRTLFFFKENRSVLIEKAGGILEALRSPEPKAVPELFDEENPNE